MKRALSDASSAILLFKAGLLKMMTGAFRLCVVPSVFQEITVGEHPGAVEFGAALAAGELQVVASPQAAAAGPLGALGDGERDTLLAFEQGAADFVIMDDGKGALYCRRRRIPYINALLCPGVLGAAGYLDETACAAAFERVLRLGHYSRWVVDFARTCEPADLERFLPDRRKALAQGALRPRALNGHLLNN